MRKLFPVLLVLSILIGINCSQQKTEWQGTVEEIDGVQVVKNPKEPLYGEDVFVLEEELTIGEVEGREEYMFQQIYNLVVAENGDIYILDYKAQHVKVFDRDGQYLRTIGRPGQGPGELFLARILVLTTRGEVAIQNINNISYFSREGEFLRSTPLTKGRILTIDIDDFGNIFGYSIEGDKGVYELKKYDPEFNELFSLGTSPLPTAETQKTGKRNAFFTLLRWDLINGDQVVTGYPEEGYLLKIFNAEGILIRKIEKDYTPLEITKEDFEAEKEDYPPELSQGLYAPKHFPPFRTLRSDDEGRIWVFTSKKTADGERVYWDVFDAEGKYIFEVALKASPRIFNNKMYAIEEDEDGYQYVKRYRIVWNF